MSGSDDVHQAERQTILTRLLDAVKQCQVRFGGKTELATDGDARVSCLCSAWELALQHGMRHNNKALSTLKQVTEITGLTRMATGIGLLEDFKNLETEPAYWGYVKEFLHKHELQRYSLLKNIQTDAGRSRAWLRSALNEKSLERYMHMLLEDDVKLRIFYEDWAFLCDEERSCMLPNMAAGLGSILFAINIDNEELNTIKPPKGLETLVSSTPPTSLYASRVEDEPRPVIAGGEGSPSAKKKERKKRKKVANLVSFDEDDLSSYSASPASSLTSPRSTNSGVDLPAAPVIIASPSTSSTSSSKTQEIGLFTDEPVKQTPAIPKDVKIQKTNVEGLSHHEQSKPVSEISSPCPSDLSSSKNESHQNNDIMSSKSAVPDSVVSDVLRDPTDLQTQTSVEEAKSKENRGDSTSESFINLLKDSVSDCQKTDERSKIKSSPGFSHSNRAFQQEYSGENLVEELLRQNNSNLNSTLINAHINSKDSSSLIVNKGTHRHIPRKDSESSLQSDSSILSATKIPSDLIPLNAEGKPVEEDSASSDSSNAKDLTYERKKDESGFHISTYCDATENAAYALALAQKGWMDSFSQELRTQGDGSHAPEPISPKQDTMSTAELKQAVVAMMLRKDEVEEQNRSLLVMLDSERDLVASLKAEINDIKKSNLLRQEKDNEKAKALTRENELLKHQLKKYVNAVQMLRRQGAKAEDFPGIHVDEPQPEIPPVKQTIDYSFEASEYERKLIQVAEMHGELMEFNEILHKQLNSREIQVKRLKQELVDLRGPLPNDLEGPEDTASISSDSSNHTLINVWIPSAFLRGTTSDAYHVYQIFIRIRDEEWNVYRRYTEFSDLHSKLKKKYPVIGSFDFPKKKAIGNKEPKFVEERRKKLQAYLRKLINVLVQSHPELAVNACRERLVDTIDFFGDALFNSKKNKKKGKSSDPRSTEAAEGSSSSSQYMGL